MGVGGSTIPNSCRDVDEQVAHYGTSSGLYSRISPTGFGVYGGTSMAFCKTTLPWDNAGTYVKPQHASLPFIIEAWGRFVGIFLSSAAVPQEGLYIRGYQSSDCTFVSADKLLPTGMYVKSLINNNNKHTIYAGNTLPLEEGYAIDVGEISNGKAICDIVRNGNTVDTFIVQTGDTIVYKRKIGEVSDFPTLVIHVQAVLIGTEATAVQFDCVWQVSDAWLTGVNIALSDAYFFDMTEQTFTNPNNPKEHYSLRMMIDRTTTGAPEAVIKNGHMENYPSGQPTVLSDWVVDASNLHYAVRYPDFGGYHPDADGAAARLGAQAGTHPANTYTLIQQQVNFVTGSATITFRAWTKGTVDNAAVFEVWCAGTRIFVTGIPASENYRYINKSLYVTPGVGTHWLVFKMYRNIASSGDACQVVVDRVTSSTYSAMTGKVYSFRECWWVDSDDVYVDPFMGDDSYNGNSWSTAYKTMQRGLDNVGLGGTIHTYCYSYEHLIAPISPGVQVTIKPYKGGPYNQVILKPGTQIYVPPDDPDDPEPPDDPDPPIGDFISIGFSGSGADYICGTSGAQVKINQAIDEALDTTNMRHVRFVSPGTYWINDSIGGANTLIDRIEISAVPGVAIKLQSGLNWEKKKSLIHCYNDTNKSNIKIHGFTMDGNYDAYSSVANGLEYYNHISVRRCNGLEVYDMNLLANKSDALLAEYVDNLKFHHNYTHCGHDGVNGYNINYAKIYNNEFNCRTNCGARIYNGHTGEIYNNKIYSVGSCGSGVQLQAAAYNIKIHHNTIFNMYWSGIWCTQHGSTTTASNANAEIYDNLIYGCNRIRNAYSGGIATNGFKLNVHHNILDGNNDYGIRVCAGYYDTKNTGWVIDCDNNIISNTTNSGYAAHNNLTAAHTLSFDAGCLYNNPGGTSNITGSNNSSSDPKYVDRANKNYKLQTTSPMYNTFIGHSVGCDW